MTRRGRARRALTLLLAGSLVIAACGGDDGGETLADGEAEFALGEGEIFLESAASAGPDPFTTGGGEVFAAPGPPSVPEASTTTTSTTEPPDDPEATVVVSTAGDQPGLYGGTRDSARCDVEGLAAFLEENPDKAQAWIDAQSVDPTVTELDAEGLGEYLRSLTPVTLLADTRVTNNGFRDGLPTPRQAVLEAGTAVLVDEFGVPRTKCACGNPLRPPEPSSVSPRFVGDEWPGFDADAVVVVVAASQPVAEFVLLDLEGGEPFTRSVGTTPGFEIADRESDENDDADGQAVAPGAYEGEFDIESLEQFFSSAVTGTESNPEYLENTVALTVDEDGTAPIDGAYVVETNNNFNPDGSADCRSITRGSLSAAGPAQLTDGGLTVPAEVTDVTEAGNCSGSGFDDPTTTPVTVTITPTPDGLRGSIAFDIPGFDLTLGFSVS